MQHDRMDEEDWERLLQHPRCKWPEEPDVEQQQTIVNILRTLDTQAAGALTGLRNSDIQPLARKISDQD